MREIKIRVANREDEEYVLPIIAELCRKYTQSYKISVISNGKEDVYEIYSPTDADRVCY